MYRYLMRKWRPLRVILSILIGWLVVYYYVSLYHPSLIRNLWEHHTNETDKNIRKHYELKHGHYMEVKPLIENVGTACDLLQSGLPLNTAHVINPDPYDNVIVPQTDCDTNVYLVIYVHSSPHLQHRRNTIRRTWGKVSQYDVPIRLVFIVGETDDNDAEMSPKDSLKVEINNYGDIVQSNFADSYRNLSHKAIAGLKWVTQHCRSAKFVLKTDDDAFVNVYLLLRLMRLETNLGHYEENALVCNLRVGGLGETPIDRSGKWKATFEECSLTYFPTFCQGLAFLMTMNVAEALYDVSKYVPLLWMDDVYITGFLPALLPNKGIKHLQAGPFYMSAAYINKTTSHQVLSGADAFKFIFYHEDDMRLIDSAWNNLKQIVQTQTFSNYSDAMLGTDMQLERKRLKNVACTEWSRARDLCYFPPKEK